MARNELSIASETRHATEGFEELGLQSLGPTQLLAPATLTFARD